MHVITWSRQLFQAEVSLSGIDSSPKMPGRSLGAGQGRALTCCGQLLRALPVNLSTAGPHSCVILIHAEAENMRASRPSLWTEVLPVSVKAAEAWQQI